MLYATDELLNSTFETNDVLYVGQLNLKKKKKLHDIGFGNDFLDMTLKVQETKE